jgi:hypothetical protein
MLILLDGRPLQYTAPGNERTLLILSIIGSLTREHGIKWLFLVDQNWQQGSFPDIAGEEVLIKRALPGRAGWRLWYDWQIPRLVKKWRPDRVILTGGIAAGPLPAPQSVWMPVCANPKETKGPMRLYASRLGETLRRGDSFFVFSEKDRAWLSARGRVGEDKFRLIRPWPSRPVAPLSGNERAMVKDRFAQGKEFFFADVSETGGEDLVYLLKAFSIFKKRQQSNLQLLLAGDPSAVIGDKLDTYKYRQDVHWCAVAQARDENVAAAAYAALYLFADDSPGTPLVEGWAAGVPVVVTLGTRLAELAGDAALTSSAKDATALAGHLMSIYKDEGLRGRLIEKGLSRLPEFGAADAAARVWAVIGRAFADIQH